MAIEEDGEVVAFALTSSYRPRECYARIAEFSGYAARDARGCGAGRLAMKALLEEAKKADFWKFVSRLFPENEASSKLPRSLGFQEIDTYEKQVPQSTLTSRSPCGSATHKTPSAWCCGRRYSSFWPGRWTTRR